MKIGFSLSNNQGIEDVQLVLGLASKAEDMGFDSVWAAEHVFNVSYVHDRIGDRPYYEPLSILSYAAATTKRIGLGTSVLVLPYHNPMRLAKTAATLDVISGGRLLLGVGVGVIEQELVAMGSSTRDRGAYTDECIAIMKELWTQDDPAYEGRFHSFSGMKFSPRPVQKPHVPLLIGGTSQAAIRRAARSGDGWHPMAMEPDELRRGMDYLARKAGEAGRDPGDIPVSVSAAIGETGSRGRYALGSGPDEILRRAAEYESLGIHRLVISSNTQNPEELEPTMEMLAEKVLPAFA